MRPLQNLRTPCHGQQCTCDGGEPKAQLILLNSGKKTCRGMVHAMWYGGWRRRPVSDGICCSRSTSCSLVRSRHYLLGVPAPGCQLLSSVAAVPFSESRYQKCRVIQVWSGRRENARQEVGEHLGPSLQFVLLLLLTGAQIKLRNSCRNLQIIQSI